MLIPAAIAGELLFVVGVGLPRRDDLFDAMLQQAIDEPGEATERRALGRRLRIGSCVEQASTSTTPRPSPFRRIPRRYFQWRNAVQTGVNDPPGNDSRNQGNGHARDGRAE